MPCFIHTTEPRVEIEFGRLYRRSGGSLFMCGSDTEDVYCFNCPDVGDYLCDYPVGSGKTCDRALCDRHRKSVAPEIDYCATHYEEWEKYRDSGAPLKHFESVVPFHAEKSPK